MIIVGELIFLLIVGEAQDRWSQQDVAIHGRISGAVEESVEGVKLFLRDGIELVIVTHSAASGEAHPHGDGGVCAIHGITKDEFFGDAAALAGGDVAAVEARRDLLIQRGVGKEITRELPARELIIRQVVIEGAHHPVAVGPHAAFIVEVQPVGVGIAGDIEPEAAHVLAVAFGLQQAADDFLIRIRAGVGEEGIHFSCCRGQAGEVERHAADQRFLRGFRRRGETFFSEAGLNKRVDTISDRSLDRRRSCLDRLFKGPVLLVFRALADPELECFQLLRRDLFMRLRRWHDFIGIGTDDARDDAAGLHIARLDGKASFDGFVSALGGVETQVGLPFLRIEAMAGEAVVTEDRADVAIEVELRRCLG